MTDEYRNDLAAAQARIAQLEARLTEGAAAPDLEWLEAKHAALVRSVPSQARVRLMAGLAAFVSAITLGSMFFLASPYDTHPRFSIAMQMLVICGMVASAFLTRLGRLEGLKAVALSEQLLAAEQARAALQSRVRVAGDRIASAEPLEAESEVAAASDRALRR